MPEKKPSPSQTGHPDLRDFEEVLKRASEKNASDLHLKSGLPPVVRVNGGLFYLGQESSEKVIRLADTTITRWAQALMSPRQREAFERGEEVDLGYEVVGVGRYRINLCQQRGRPRLVCRNIPDTVRTLQDLGLVESVSKILEAQRGLILVTGGTGSGKSTTLAAMIDHITRTRSCHIVTIEDPIEFTFKDRKSIVTQREVGTDTGSFTRALKYALRQDPDVILVGEMRDEETIQMALTAAETGHLVLSTLHTNDATETINRILAGINPGAQHSVRLQLASVLVGVVSQRLIGRSDKSGRVVALEILINNTRVRELIEDPKRTSEIRQVIDESESLGMLSFDRSLMLLCKGGLITEKEALAQCTNPNDFRMRLAGVTSGDYKARIAKSVESLSDELIEIEGATPTRKKSA